MYLLGCLHYSGAYKKIILSVKIMPETIQRLNLDMIDPSDSMRNFVHNMNFKKTSGFNEVDRVS